MSGGLANINLLALVLAIKSQRRNSLLYAHEKNYILAVKFGMATATFKKYMAELVDLGLIEEVNGHRRVISLSACISVLLAHQFGADRKDIKHCRFFTGQQKLYKVKDFVLQIRLAIAKLNFHQQKHNIDKNDFLDRNPDRYSRSEIRRCKKLCREQGYSSIEQLVSTGKRLKSVVTGKYHISRLLGCSPSTGLKTLRKWAAMGLIKRDVIRLFFPHFVCPASLESFCEKGYRHVQPTPSGFVVYLGSAVQVVGSQSRVTF